MLKKKRKVGRPSNKQLRRERNFKIFVGSACALLIGILVYQVSDYADSSKLTADISQVPKGSYIKDSNLHTCAIGAYNEQYPSKKVSETHALSAKELANIKTLRCSKETGKQISNLSGIKYFKNLRVLDIEVAANTKVNLSSNKKLTFVNLGNNPLEKVNISKNIKLVDAKFWIKKGLYYVSLPNLNYAYSEYIDQRTNSRKYEFSFVNCDKVYDKNEGFEFGDNIVASDLSIYNKVYDAGTYTISVSPRANAKWKDSTTGAKKISCKVSKLDMKSARIAKVKDQKYTGIPVTPEPIVQITYDGGLNYYNLTKNVDYTYSYTNNNKPGNATITITGIGNYEGVRTINFKIIETGNTNTSNIVLNADNRLLKAECANSPVTFNITNTSGTINDIWMSTDDVDSNGDKNSQWNRLIKSNGDSTCGENEKSNTCVVTLNKTHKRIYFKATDENNNTLKIFGPYSTCVSNSNAQTKSNTATQAKIEIVNKNRNLSDTRCYSTPLEFTFKETTGTGIWEVRYKTDQRTTWEHLVWGESKPETKVTIKNSHEKIWFRVYDVNKNIKEYGPYKVNINNDCNTAKTENIKYTTNISDANVSVTNQIYTGKKLTPNPIVKIGSTTLTKNVDYTLSYKDNIKVGTATIILKGKGKYSGTKKVTFKIVKKSQTNNQENVAKIEIVNKNRNLSDAKCYSTPLEFTFKETTGTGIWEVKYKTNQRTTWEHLAWGNNDEAKIKISNAHEKIWFRVYDVNKNTKEYGPYKVNIKSNCASTSATTSLHNAKVESIPDQTYTGKAIKPEPKVTLNGKVLVKDVDYTYTYENNVEPLSSHSASVTIHGKGKYRDTKTIKFKIVKKSQTNTQTQTAKIEIINKNRNLSDTRCYSTPLEFTFKETTGTGIWEVRYKTDQKTTWEHLVWGESKLEAKVTVKNYHEKIWFRVYDVNKNIKEYGPIKTNIKSRCNTVNNTSSSTQQVPAQTQTVPSSQTPSNSTTSPTQVNTIKVSGIDTKSCKKKGVSFTIDSTSDGGASIKKVEFSTDKKTWKTSSSCTISGKKATCKINSKYDSIYYKVTTSHNHYQIFGKFCTK